MGRLRLYTLVQGTKTLVSLWLARVFLYCEVTYLSTPYLLIRTYHSKSRDTPTLQNLVCINERTLVSYTEPGDLQQKEYVSRAAPLPCRKMVPTAIYSLKREKYGRLNITDYVISDLTEE